MLIEADEKLKDGNTDLGPNLESLQAGSGQQTRDFIRKKICFLAYLFFL